MLVGTVTSTVAMAVGQGAVSQGDVDQRTHDDAASNEARTGANGHGAARSLRRPPCAAHGSCPRRRGRGALARPAVDAVIVSHHGGGQLDHVPATVEILPVIVETVGGRADPDTLLARQGGGVDVRR